MKVKLLKRLRKKYIKEISNYVGEEVYNTNPIYYYKLCIRCQVKRNITKYRLWYKLLTTITHKKDVDKT